MLSKLKKDLMNNRYVYNLRKETRGMKRGLIRNIIMIRGGISILVKHKFDIWDYTKEFDAIQTDNYKYSFDYDKHEIVFYIPLFKTDYIQRYIANNRDFYGEFELSYLRERVIKPGAVILDIGANIGNHTIFFGKICKARKIFSFEPIPDTYNILVRNIKLNGLDNIASAVNVALGSEKGKAEISFLNVENSGSTQIKLSEEGDLVLCRLDDFDFPTVDFIKIDVEKYEYNMLIGAEKTLKKYNPIIFIEIFDECFEKVDSLLREYGYKKVDTVTKQNYLYMPIKV